MEEARRSLRYIFPGIVLILETLAIVLVIEPGTGLDLMAFLGGQVGVGTAIALLLLSGGLGYLLGQVHHWTHWRSRLGAVDHSAFISDLRQRRILSLVQRGSGHPLSPDAPVDRFRSWTLVTSLWHERVSCACRPVSGANDRINSLADLVHSAGSGRIAAVLALVLALAVLAWKCTLTCDRIAIMRFAAGMVLYAAFVALHHWNYRRTGDSLQHVAEQVLGTELAHEARASGQPVEVQYRP